MTDHYAQSGVDTDAEEKILTGLMPSILQTFENRKGLGKPLLPIGYYANVIDVFGRGIAISTDGVGTKMLVAEQLRQYESVGSDCVAANVNDLICVGATPLALVDYIAVQTLDSEVLRQIGRGLVKGAWEAGITIPGGEIAQVPEMVSGVHSGKGVDLIGTCIGVVAPHRIVRGDRIHPGDVVIGLASNGIHNNGFSLARQALFTNGAPYNLRLHLTAIDRTLGEELLRPTQIYVKVIEDIRAALDYTGVKALAHITSDGLLNLLRVESLIGFRIDYLPNPPFVFDLIQKSGKIPTAEMYSVFNMGIGFCVTVSPEHADRVLGIAAAHNIGAWRLGVAVEQSRRTLELAPLGLVSRDNKFVPVE